MTKLLLSSINRIGGFPEEIRNSVIYSKINSMLCSSSPPIYNTPDWGLKDISNIWDHDHGKSLII